ncbi:MAG: TIGR01777 family protein [Acidobacteria bacterium]|nr:TIGR01777 family protein [Acidobacteriota bacterium]
MQIVVAGGTGFLGAALVNRLRTEGHRVTVLTRQPRDAQDVQWQPYGSSASWVHALEEVDAVINLAGAPIAKRWTATHKREMWNSRVRATRTLVAAMKSVRRMPATLINASAVGVYGDRGDEPLTEQSAPGSGFLVSLGREWEKEALSAAPHARVVLLRTGIALDRDAGALPQMALPFRLFAGGPIGSGRQYLSWIHRDDWTSMVSWALATVAISGPLNVTAPNPVTNREFARTLGRVLRRPALLPVPAFALRAVLGEMADALVTGQQVFPDKAHALGFDFRHPTLDAALRTIYGEATQRT